jgi:DNA-binding transcriptional regulator YdaS (Cro superfamily)
MKPQNAFIAAAVASAGSQTELARRIGCSQVFVHQMLHGLRGVSAKLCLPIERATNGAVTRYELRPDIFGEAPDGAPLREAG